uniref:Uncharacterized protein n=1 Tax=Romanomermis culicivorax TaxID=13658 RepID=A0A915HHT1_ROMCU
MVPSTGQVVITNFGLEGMVDVVVDIGMLVAGIRGTVVEETDVKAVVGNDVIVLVVTADLGTVRHSSAVPEARGLLILAVAADFSTLQGGVGFQLHGAAG